MLIDSNLLQVVGIAIDKHKMGQADRTTIVQRVEEYRKACRKHSSVRGYQQIVEAETDLLYLQDLFHAIAESGDLLASVKYAETEENTRMFGDLGTDTPQQSVCAHCQALISEFPCIYCGADSFGLGGTGYENLNA